MNVLPTHLHHVRLRLCQRGVRAHKALQQGADGRDLWGRAQEDELVDGGDLVGDEGLELLCRVCVLGCV